MQKNYRNTIIMLTFKYISNTDFFKTIAFKPIIMEFSTQNSTFLGYILNLYVFSRLIISISRQITDIYPAPSSNYPALALI